MEEVRTTTKTNTKQDSPSNAEIMSSAKVIAAAAKSAFGNENDKINKAEVAEAAADLLGAAKKYGKLEDKSYGKVLDKAEDYLHNFNHSSNTTTSAVHGGSHVDGSGKEHGHSSSSGGKGGGGGHGEYVKMAQGFMKKDDVHHEGGGGHHGHSGAKNDGAKNDCHHGHSSSGGGGYGEYVKIAQGILRK